MVWWRSVGRRVRRAGHASRTCTPAWEPGRGCHLMPAPAHPLVVGGMPRLRLPLSAPALSATSATPVTLPPLPPLQDTSTRPRLFRLQPRWLPFLLGHPWLCPKPTSALSPSTDTPSHQDMQLFPPTSHPPFLQPGWSSTTCPRLKAARRAAPAAPPARATSAACRPPLAPPTTPTRRCCLTASCQRAAARWFRCTDKFHRRGWDNWNTHHKRRRCSLPILMFSCTTTRSSLQTCREWMLLLGTHMWEGPSLKGTLIQRIP